MVIKLRRIYKIILQYLRRNPSTVTIFFIAGLVLLAMVIRLMTNFRLELIPGINGGYYPLIARNLLEFNSLRYPDAPFIHWIIAGVGRLTSLIGGVSTNQALLISSRLIDSLIPPLTCIPILLIINAFPLFNGKKDFRRIVLPSFSILYLAPLMVLSSDMIKNSVGIVFLSAFMFLFLRLMQTGKGHYAWGAGGLLILTGLTHIGSLAVGFVFMMMEGKK